MADCAKAARQLLDVLTNVRRPRQGRPQFDPATWEVSPRHAHGSNRVLFIGHEASRTGAPITLLHLLRWLRAHTDLDFDLLLRQGGPLVEEYAKVCGVYLVPESVNLSSRRVQPVMSALFTERRYGLLYSNTVTNRAALDWLAPLNLPVLCHAHEVESHFESMDATDLSSLRACAEIYIAGTRQIQGSLMRRGIPPEKIRLIPGFIDVSSIGGRTTDLRSNLGIPEETILVGGCGKIRWQKGPDLFVQIVRHVIRAADNDMAFHFVWAGESEGPSAAELSWDIAHSGLEKHFTLIPGMADTGVYFASLDIFALTSRNDPSPLVALEAGAHGLPVVCFTGNAVMVTDECGIVVPYLDIERFAQSLLQLAGDPVLRAALGQNLARKVLAEHDVTAAGPAILDLIRACMGEQRKDLVPPAGPIRSRATNTPAT